MLWLVLLVVAASLALWLYWWQGKYWRVVLAVNGWRGILSHPVLWSSLLLFMDPSSVIDMIHRLRRWCSKPLAIYVAWWNCLFIYVDDPQTMEAVLTAPECLDKTWLQEGFFAHNGLLHASGQKWRVRRKQLNPAFSHKILLNFLGTFNTVADQLSSQLGSQLMPADCSTAYSPLAFKDLEDLLSRAVLEVSCQTTMGTSMNFLADDPQNIAKTYKTLMDLSALKVMKPWLQSDMLFSLLDPKRYRELNECSRIVEQFVGNIVECKHREWLAKQIAGNGRAECSDDDGEQRKRIFIEQIFYLAECGALTLQDIMDETHSMVLVSFETVSNTIVIALLNLAMHPDCQRNLRNELLAHLAPSSSPSLHPSEVAVSANDLQQLKYLDMVVNESLRLLTTVPMNLRHVSKEFRLKVNGSGGGGNRAGKQRIVSIPPGSVFVLDTFNMQRDPIIWGAHAETFHPEHFVSTTAGTAPGSTTDADAAANASPSAQQHITANSRHPYAFLPFSRGLRTCIGQRYSLYLTKIILIKLLTSYEFHTTTKLQDLRYVEGISLKFRNADAIQFQIRKLK